MSSNLIAVDFDKTLTTGEGTPWWEDGWEEVPDEEMVEWVNQKYREGNYIIIWTARPWRVANQVSSFLEKHGVRYHGIRCNKGAADTYIDDKTLRPEEVK